MAIMVATSNCYSVSGEILLNWPLLAGDEGAQLRDLLREIGVRGYTPRHLLHAVYHRRMIAVADKESNLFQGQLCVLPQQVHTHVPRLGYGTGPGLPRHGLYGNAEVG